MEDVVYLGAHTRYWVRVNDWRIAVVKQHYGYALDERRITWGDDVWLRFEADNAYMLDRYAEADENLLSLPDTEEDSVNALEASSASVGDGPAQDANASAHGTSVQP